MASRSSAMDCACILGNRMHIMLDCACILSLLLRGKMQAANISQLYNVDMPKKMWPKAVFKKHIVF